MSQSQVQPEYQQRVLPPRVSTLWWLEKGSYLTFILREMSCVFVAWFVVYLLLLVRAVTQGDASYQELLAWSATTPILLLNTSSFLFLIFHAVTFFGGAAGDGGEGRPQHGAGQPGACWPLRGLGGGFGSGVLAPAGGVR